MTPATRRMRNCGIAAGIALIIGAAAASAQTTPPPPPPRAPQIRPPRPPRAWFNGSGDGVARIDTVVSFASNGTVDLSLVSGSMKISTWDRNQVRVVASTTGEPSLQFEASSSHIDLEQEGRHSNRNGDNTGRATFEVTVPVGTRATLSAVAGSIDASGMRGSLDISNVSGSIDVRNVGSTLSIDGVSGSITVANVGSDVHVQNVSGRISVAGVGGTVSAETVSGGISVTGVRGDRVHATSVSGNLEYVGPISGSGRYDFETHSGRTELRLASNANAAISVETFSGSVTNDYPGAVRRRNGDPGDDRTSFDYVLGRGDARVRVETFSGSVHISQGTP